MVGSVILLGTVLLTWCDGQAFEINGDLSIQGSLFPEPGAWPQQDQGALSLAGTLEYYQELSSTIQLNLVAWYRLDSNDSNRSHGDLRLAEFLYLQDNWELSCGLGRVFWGATEFVHLVDIINQTDQVEDRYGEEKLGQPMLHLTIPRSTYVLEAFVLPWFRERKFPGINGRFRPPLPVVISGSRYESAAGRHHLDLALRYSTTLGQGDLGLSYFTGTTREPALLFSTNPEGGIGLTPFYQQISQAGLDFQTVAGQFLLKAEATYRVGQGRPYGATTFGLEYAIIQIGGSTMDLGLIGEYVYDDRDDGWTSTIYQNDIMGGLRLSLNDMEDTTLLIGAISDIKYASTILSIEGSRRLRDRIRVNLDATLFLAVDPRDPAFSIAKDTVVQLEIVCYW